MDALNFHYGHTNDSDTDSEDDSSTAGLEVDPTSSSYMYFFGQRSEASRVLDGHLPSLPESPIFLKTRSIQSAPFVKVGDQDSASNEQQATTTAEQLGQKNPTMSALILQKPPENVVELQQQEKAILSKQELAETTVDLATPNPMEGTVERQPWTPATCTYQQELKPELLEQKQEAGEGEVEEEDEESEAEREMELGDTHVAALITPQPQRGRVSKYSIPKSNLPSHVREFLAEVRSHFTKPIQMQRQKPPIANSTYSKAEERLLCFLGYVRHGMGMSLTTDLFLRGKVIEKYLSYLKEERKLCAATISNHAASLLYPAKFLHMDSAPEYTSVKVIKQLRVQVAYFQRLGNVQRPSTKEQLQEKNRWLDWPDVMKAVALQRERLEMATTAQRKARECADLLLMALYTFIPPARGLEIRTLEIAQPATSPSNLQYSGRNMVFVDEDGQVTFHFQNYKTVKTYGADQTVLKPDHELAFIMRDYLKKHRQTLINEESADYLLVNSAGKPFTTSSAFSGHLKFLFHRVTGVGLSVNVLRSSFLTHAYGQSSCTDSIKDSLASALRHSRRQAQLTYDKRNTTERKTLALSLASQFAGENLQDTGNFQQGEFETGDFVGLVEESSTVNDPRILVGRIQAFLPDNQASLLWFKESDRPGDYFFQFEATPWIESVTSMRAIKMTPVKKTPGVYRLKSTPKSIHRAVLGKQ